MPIGLIVVQGTAGATLAAVGIALIARNPEASVRLCGGGLIVLAIGLAADLAIAWAFGGMSSFEAAPGGAPLLKMP